MARPRYCFELMSVLPSNRCWGLLSMNNSLDKRSAARMQSFTTKAVAVLVLYWVLYLPGLIANVIFYREAKRMEHIADADIPGTGCLATMLWSNIVLIVLGVAIAILLRASMRVR